MVAEAKRKKKEGKKAEVGRRQRWVTSLCMCVYVHATFKNKAWLKHLNVMVSLLFGNQNRNFYELSTIDNILRWTTTS